MVYGVNGERLVAAIRDQGQPVDFVASLEQLRSAVARELRAGDLALFLGAGDITRVAQQVAMELRERPMSDRENLAAELVIVLIMPKLFKALVFQVAQFVLCILVKTTGYDSTIPGDDGIVP